ncbi:hypothetical protein [Erythrobacter sp. MTPC3]|uniref:hypothetical protein n=1 Tax=Erythrobacter sp. MTPC3 TaxID=3056564 RepID=UPI0036F360C1
MLAKFHHPHLEWRPLERVAFGLIYGAILVLSLLMAAGESTDMTFKTALVLFGSVLAVALAKGFAELVAHAIETGERMLTKRALCSAWNGSHPTLAVVVLPTALFLAAGLGLCSSGIATVLSQAYCLAILVLFGARVGWVIGHGPWLSISGALFAGGIGSALAAMKYVLH